MKRGKVYLVGAGPGDPGLLTIKGREVLEKAEVVIYDYLANEEFLAYAPPHAERIYVGKKGGDHTLSQDGINALLVEKGRDRIVVRLKGGDPFVFGRGGEEAQELVAHGIPFEVVPGISAAVAVPAYAGIPLSHRDLTSAIAFVTGHEREDREEQESRIAWDKLATAAGTLVFFMGVRNLPHICRKLTENGRSPQTPAAVIRWGTTARQRTVVGTLADISQKVKEAGLAPPAMIVVGEVVSCREELNWFENRPLFGRTVVVTRAREQASGFKRMLEDLGARCIEFPTIQIAPPPSWEPLDRAVNRLSDYDWAVFTSVNGVGCFMERLLAAGLDVRELKGVKLAAIGPSTAEALRNLGLLPDLVPGEYRAEAILERLAELGEIEGKRFLIARALDAREILPERLKAMGAEVEVVPAYQTVLPEEDAAAMAALFKYREISCVTFTSSSTVTNFFALMKGEEIRSHLRGVAIACIGPITADTARDHGLAVDIMPSGYTVPELVQSIVDHFAQESGPK